VEPAITFHVSADTFFDRSDKQIGLVTEAAVDGSDGQTTRACDVAHGNARVSVSHEER
jgi:hypothetical protein